MTILIKILFFYFIYSTIKKVLKSKFSIQSQNGGFQSNQSNSSPKSDPTIVEAEFREVK